MIRHVVFDVGWVFVDLKPQPLLDLLTAHGASGLTLGDVVERIDLHEHESGRLHGRGLLGKIAALAARAPAHDAVQGAWLDMFELQPRMVELARRLATRQRVHLLSNVGDLHWAHLCETYELHRIGHGALPSFEAGVMKPHAAIYAEAERRFGLVPAQTVFIDDRDENIAAARARGWHGIVHKDYDTTRAALRELGVDTD